MAEKVKKGDFVEIEYTGAIKDSNTVFDTTNAEIAKKEGFFDPKHKYGPAIVCVGQKQLLEGLDEFVDGKDVGTEYDVLIAPENGFGNKDAKNMKIVPTNVFTKQN
ncbi:FKBP-type peptidyl-prolyl cis-trans isomerase, partial [Candidatus Woesearchaeota archaeon]|nr:FKBP-type peptidyl-prolyl cis-trans isomerase [Candidatus Woesearchaeota archaeon]